MGLEKLGLLFAILEPPEAMEEEFNDWYDTEHIPERAAIPGILTCQRFVYPAGSPRYLALYDLENTAVMESEAYRNVGPGHYSPWTQRINRHARVFIRRVYEQTFPGKTCLSDKVGTLVLQEYDVRPGKEVLVDQWFAHRLSPSLQEMAGHLSTRRFVCIDASPRYLTLIEFEDPRLVENERFREVFPGWQDVEEHLEERAYRVYRKYERT